MKKHILEAENSEFTTKTLAKLSSSNPYSFMMHMQRCPGFYMSFFWTAIDCCNSELIRWFVDKDLLKQAQDQYSPGYLGKIVELDMNEDLKILLEYGFVGHFQRRVLCPLLVAVKHSRIESLCTILSFPFKMPVENFVYCFNQNVTCLKGMCDCEDLIIDNLFKGDLIKLS
jgi:hypothetical protein